MPQKKNPDALELVRGKAARVDADLLRLLVLLKGLPAGYQKDLQEDKEAVFDAVDTAVGSRRRDDRRRRRPRASSRDAMRAAARREEMMAAGLAVALAREGMPFRKAHHVVGALVAESQKSGRSLKAVAAEQLEALLARRRGAPRRALRPARGRQGQVARRRRRARRGARLARRGARAGGARLRCGPGGCGGKRLSSSCACCAAASGCASGRTSAVAQSVPGPSLPTSRPALAARGARARAAPERRSRPEPRRGGREPPAGRAPKGRAGARGDVLPAGSQLPARQDEAADRGVAPARGHEAPAEGRDPARARLRGGRPPLARVPGDRSARTATCSWATAGPDRARRAALLPDAARGRLAPGRQALRSEAPDPKAFDEELYRSITLGEEDLAAPDIWEEFANCFRARGACSPTRACASGHWRRMLDELDRRQRAVRRVPGLAGRGRRDSARPACGTRDFAVKFIPVGGTQQRSGQDAGHARAGPRRARARPRPRRGLRPVEEEDRSARHLFFVEEILAARREAERRGLSLPLVPPLGRDEPGRRARTSTTRCCSATRRIGHGLALVRHPLLMEMARERGVAVEVCPISNQVLGYVRRPARPPGGRLHQRRDPRRARARRPRRDAAPFSYDFYEAFMAWDLDLRELKQLAMNSLVHSAMDPRGEAAGARGVARALGGVRALAERGGPA